MIEGDAAWDHERRPWRAADGLALACWTAALVLFFWDVVTLRRALFYFDITEINYPYRHFLAGEMRLLRFSRWFPGLYCGMPLYSESQAGYLHPLKYFLYPWLSTWAAFNLDTVLSIWLTGLGTYGWLRRHVGAAGALTGAAVFGLGGYTWAHLIHTSMINALASVPLAFWALECAWEGGRLRGVALGALALACQVFAGHLQDTILTGTALGAYGFYRASLERVWQRRAFALGGAVGMVALAALVSAVQWVPSKELLDRSPRADGLTWDELTYGSWHPELLPTLVVREAYGTRARDTDWMDGFYPYHEMDIYLGVTSLALAGVGAAAARDRWVGFWLVLAGMGGMLMLGRYTFLFDYAPHVPVFGSSRIPVRFHLWVSLAVAALAGVGVDRLSRPGRVKLRAALGLIGVLVLISIPVMVLIYLPVWLYPHRWSLRSHLDRYRWLGDELVWSSARTALLAGTGWFLAAWAARQDDPRRRRRITAWLPVVVMAELLGAHWQDVPTVPPSYWTEPPASARHILADPDHQRVIGTSAFSSGEPGYASEPERVDFFAVRDTLAWSLPPVWGLSSTIGETPILPRRRLWFTDSPALASSRFDIEGASHLLSGFGGTGRLGEPVRLGSAYLYRNPTALPRVRLLGRPLYATGPREALALMEQHASEVKDRIVVEDPDRLLPEETVVAGTARIVRDEPERVEVTTEAPGPSYVFLADTFDPGWSATVDGRPCPVRPALVAFRAVFVPAGKHTVVFTYRPAGFDLGLMVTAVGTIVVVLLLVWPRRIVTLSPTHGESDWPRSWPWWGLALAIAIVGASAIGVRSDGQLGLHSRWDHSVHPFTWGAGLEAMKARKPPAG